MVQTCSHDLGLEMSKCLCLQSCCRLRQGLQPRTQLHLPQTKSTDRIFKIFLRTFQREILHHKTSLLVQQLQMEEH